jgi:hypothetical protein
MVRVVHNLCHIDGTHNGIYFNRVIFFFEETFNDWEQKFFGMGSLELVSYDRNALSSSSPHHRGVIFTQFGELFSNHCLKLIIQLWIDISIEETSSNPH